MRDRMLHLHLPPKLHAALKVKAATQGTTMQKLVTAVLTRVVAQKRRAS